MAKVPPHVESHVGSQGNRWSSGLPAFLSTTVDREKSEKSR